MKRTIGLDEPDAIRKTDTIVISNHGMIGRINFGVETRSSPTKPQSLTRGDFVPDLGLRLSVIGSSLVFIYSLRINTLSSLSKLNKI